MAVGDKCFDCGGMGFEDKPCPRCGRQAKKLNLSSEEPEVVKEFVGAMDRLGIPEEYQGNEWSATKFWRSNSFRRNGLLEKFIKKLEQLHDMFAQGKVPQRGVIVIAPSTYSKITWGFSCMSHALKHGYTVAPMLDTLEANRLVLNSSNPRFKLYQVGEGAGIDYDTYIMSDVLFLTVTKTEQRKASYAIIREIMHKRSRKGLSTFVLSEFSMEEMSAWDTTGSFIKIKDYMAADETRSKVPAILMYKEGLSR